MRLDEAVEAILMSIKGSLVAATVDGGLLQDVNSVVRGDRARSRPEAPTIWVFADIAQMTGTPTTLRETWKFPVILTAIYKEPEDPEVGYSQASKLAALARSVVLQDRTLGLQFVQDTKSTRFEVSSPWHKEGDLYASVAVVEVTFAILE